MSERGSLTNSESSGCRIKRDQRKTWRLRGDKFAVLFAWGNAIIKCAAMFATTRSNGEIGWMPLERNYVYDTTILILLIPVLDGDT